MVNIPKLSECEMKRPPSIVGAVGIVALVGAVFLAPQASANEPGIIVPGPPVLPPLGPPNGYVNPYAKYWSVPALGIRICIANPVHFANDVVNRENIGPDERETFNSSFFGDLSVIAPDGSTQQMGRIGMAGPTTTVVHGKVGQVTGGFDTEMLSLDLTGSVLGNLIMIRESPTRASTGRTSISDLGGNMFRIESFFDVWTEISLDGGATWNLADDGPARMTLIPEPASGLLLALGGLGMSLLRRRQRMQD